MLYQLDQNLYPLSRENCTDPKVLELIDAIETHRVKSEVTLQGFNMTFGRDVDRDQAIDEIIKALSIEVEGEELDFGDLNWKE